MPLMPVCAPPTVGPLTQSVFGPPPAVDSLIVMLFDPAITQSMPVDSPVLPAVFPVLLAPRPFIALWFDCAATLPVTVEPLMPKLTPLELLNVSADRLLLVVPALTLIFVSDVATLAVTVEALMPKLTPLELLKVTADSRLLVVPALS